MAQEQEKRRKEEIRKRVKEILGQMSLKEKSALLSGKDNWSTIAIERLGIPPITTADGPHGVRRFNSERIVTGTATYFPTGVSMASSWNPELIGKVSGAIAEETRALGFDIILGPCINIIRHPLAGRDFESFSEDPYLAGKIGVAYVDGVQKNNVGTSLKHYACNSQETERMRGNSVVDERTLREIYLSAFEMVVKESKPWTLMCSYNRINGKYASENHHLLTEILRDEWDFEGLVMSDWTATHSTVDALAAGLDLEMPGPEKHFGARAQDAVAEWKLDESIINRSAARMLELIMLSGKIMGDGFVSNASINTPEHQKLARDLAEESITLLKNSGGILPLNKNNINSIAVIGPNADIRISGGGSSYVYSPYFITSLDGLKEVLGTGAELYVEKGCENYDRPPIMNPQYLTGLSGENGLTVEYFNNAELSGAPVLKFIDTNFDHWTFDQFFGKGLNCDQFSARWTGKVNSPSSGRHTMHAQYIGNLTLKIDGKTIPSISDKSSPSRLSLLNTSAFEFDLSAGRAHDITIEYAKPTYVETGFLQLFFGFFPLPEEDDRIRKAAELAAKSDVVLVFAGMSEGYETEGADRPNMKLPGRQDELIRAVAEANHKTVVVVNSGVPVEMPWISEVQGVVEAFYMGQEGARALSDILVGNVNPSGKLSMTFPIRLEDTPAYINFPGGRDVLYGEGIFVGYRYYDKRDMEPLFPFGHGLSYTEFKYTNMNAPGTFKPGEPLEVSIDVENLGQYDGKEVVQLYVSDMACSVARPPKELKGFAKVEIARGERKTVKFLLDERAFSFYDPIKKGWAAEPGEFEILIGSSSRDIRARAVVKLEE